MIEKRKSMDHNILYVFFNFLHRFLYPQPLHFTSLTLFLDVVKLDTPLYLKKYYLGTFGAGAGKISMVLTKIGFTDKKIFFPQ